MHHAVDANPATFRFDVPRATVTHTLARPPSWRNRLGAAAETLKIMHHVLKFIHEIIDIVNSLFSAATVKRKLD